MKNVRSIAALTATSAALSVAGFAGTAGASVPDGAIQCVENTKASVAFYLENGYVRPAPPCKPLS